MQDDETMIKTGHGLPEVWIVIQANEWFFMTSGKRSMKTLVQMILKVVGGRGTVWSPCSRTQGAVECWPYPSRFLYGSPYNWSISIEKRVAVKGWYWWSPWRCTGAIFSRLPNIPNRKHNMHVLYPTYNVKCNVTLHALKPAVRLWT